MIPVVSDSVRQRQANHSLQQSVNTKVDLCALSSAWRNSSRKESGLRITRRAHRLFASPVVSEMTARSDQINAVEEEGRLDVFSVSLLSHVLPPLLHSFENIASDVSEEFLTRWTFVTRVEWRLVCARKAYCLIVFHSATRESLLYMSEEP